MIRHALRSAALLALLAPGLLAQSASTFWPAHEGDLWTYEARGGIAQGETTQARVVRIRGGWTRIEGFLGTNDWWMSPTGGRIVVWDTVARRPSVVFDLGVGQGKSFTSGMGQSGCVDGAVWTLTQANVAVDSPVGRFEGCAIVRVTRPVCADIAFDYVVFAPKVGIVEFGGATRAGIVRNRLVGALVGGRSYVRQDRPGSLSVAVSLDATAVLEPDGRPVPVTAALTIRNETSREIEFEHNTTQEYDFVIHDASGLEVWRWSAGRSFGDRVHSRSLAAGASLRYEEVIDLSRIGVRLRSGYYALEAVHVTNAPPALQQRSRIAFEVIARTGIVLPPAGRPVGPRAPAGNQ